MVFTIFQKIRKGVWSESSGPQGAKSFIFPLQSEHSVGCKFKSIQAKMFAKQKEHAQMWYGPEGAFGWRGRRLGRRRRSERTLVVFPSVSTKHNF